MSSRRRGRSRPNFKLVWPIVLVLGVLVFGTTGYATAAHLEENDGFCASCHSEPEATFFERTQAASAVDLASYHHNQATTRCIDCHAGPGISGRLGAMTVGAGDLVAFVSGQARQPAPLTVPIGDANCLKCHADIPATRDFNFHFHAFLTRWQARDAGAATCVDCHSGHATDGSVDLMYLEKTKTQAVCQGCHQVLRREG